MMTVTASTTMGVVSLLAAPIVFSPTSYVCDAAWTGGTDRRLEIGFPASPTTEGSVARRFPAFATTAEVDSDLTAKLQEELATVGRLLRGAEDLRSKSGAYVHYAASVTGAVQTFVGAEQCTQENAESLYGQLRQARAWLGHSVESLPDWLTVAALVAPDADSFDIPERFVVSEPLALDDDPIQAESIEVLRATDRFLGRV